MMAFETKDGQGALFNNQEKVVGSKQPDLRGYLQLGDEKIQIAGWKKKSKAGSEYISLLRDDKMGEGEEGCDNE
jgi:uncharacterized protein (DUF736 family)